MVFFFSKFGKMHLSVSCAGITYDRFCTVLPHNAALKFDLIFFPHSTCTVESHFTKNTFWGQKNSEEGGI